MSILTIHNGQKKLYWEYLPPKPLSEVLETAGFPVHQPCGGRGICEKCAAKISGAVSRATVTEATLDLRLICQTTLLGDATVILPERADMTQIQTDSSGSVSVGRAMVGAVGAAVDIGTTTIALKRYDLVTGNLLGQSAMENPQVTVAADVIGRIDVAMKGNLRKMQSQVRDALAFLLEKAGGSADVMVVTGNTTMLYLLEGKDPSSLSSAPFEADCLFDYSTTILDTLPRQCLRNRGERDRYYASDTHPGIIDRQSYDAVQHLLWQRSEKHVQHTVNTSPLGGRFICGKCGAGFRRKQNKGNAVFSCMSHVQDLSSCDMPPIPEDAVMQAFLRLYDNLKHGEILQFIQKTLSAIRSRKMLWSTDIVELNQKISDISSQSHKLSTLNRRGMVDPDIFISKSNQLAEQLRNAKQQKERILQQEDRSILDSTEQLLETIEAGPEVLEAFDEELFCELIDKIIVESNVKIRFRLKNGLELPETMERMVR